MRTRSAVRWLVVVAVAVGVAGPAGRAAAAPPNDEVVVVSTPDRFEAGGAGGVLTLSVIRRQEPCVYPRGMTFVALPKMGFDDFRVEVYIRDEWQESYKSVTNDDHMVRTEDLALGGLLCPGQTRTMKYRFTFVAGAPLGQTTITSIISDMGYISEMGRVSMTRPVVAGGRTVRATPTSRPRATVATGAPSTTAPTQQTVSATDGRSENAGSGAAVAAPPDVLGPPWTLVGGVLTISTLATLGSVGLLLLVLKRRRAGRQGAAVAGGDPAAI